MERRVNDVTVKLHRGDITELEVDAIVNAANNQLWMGSGVAGAIKRKGGQEIEDEAVSKGPIPIGEAQGKICDSRRHYGHGLCHR